MKTNKPMSSRRAFFLCLLGFVLLTGLLALSFGHQTLKQALRDAERTRSLAPTEIVLQGRDMPQLHSGTTPCWLFSANEDAVLFGYYHHQFLLGWRPIYNIAIDFNDKRTYSMDILHIGSEDRRSTHLFGAITDPLITEVRITPGNRYDEAYTDIPIPISIYTRDMLYENGIYYFVQPISLTYSSPYIAGVTVCYRDGTERSETFDVPRTIPKDFAEASEGYHFEDDEI